MVQLSFTLPIAHSKAPRVPRPSSPTRWAWTRRSWCTPSPWGRGSRSSSSMAGSTTWSTCQGGGRRAGLPAAHPQGGQRPRSSGRCAGGWSWWARASAPTPTRSASTRSSTSRASPARRAWSTTASSRSSTWAPRSRCPHLVEPARAGEGRRGPGLPGGHPARRPPAQHPRDVGGLPRGLPGRDASAAGRRRPSVRRGDGRRAGRRPGLLPRHDARRGGVAISSTVSPPNPRTGRAS